MNFKKDLLLIDLETTGLDAQKHEVIQLAAVLLDKKTLKEKKFFNSFVKPTKWKNRDLKSMAVNQISYKQVQNAPVLAEVIKKFNSAFNPKTVLLASYVSFLDKRMLSDAYKKTKTRWEFDYHLFDLWGLFYPYLASRNKLKSKQDFAGFGLQSLIKMFKIKINNRELHDALVDCRVEAEVLRRVIKKL